MALTGTAQDLAERLMRYAAIDSQSDETSDAVPSTAVQLNVAKELVAELQRLGAQDVTLTSYGAVLATVLGNVDGAPTIGLCAHMDTAPQYHAAGVKPRLIEAWDGSNITYPDNPELVLSPSAKPYLAKCQGHDLITASGLTLLGADDKSGIAVAMTVAAHLLGKPGLKHGALRLAFTPDEEIGRGVHPDLPADFAADFAYTLDGGRAGEIEYESFSADGATVSIKGVSIHPGQAKDVMINALHLAAELIAALDEPGTTPETTDRRAGFTHVYDMAGGSAEARLKFILRDFERDGLAAAGTRLREACDALAAKYPGTVVTCEITKQYRNMRYWLEEDMTPVNLALDACRDLGMDPVTTPIRGGTDGSRLTELGLPCPNIFTGMQEIHGPLEWISVQDMEASFNVCLKVLERAAR